MANTRIGRYEVEKELGAGAMAVVYKAVDPLIGRVVAIKTIKIDSSFGLEQAELKDRLYREAQSAGTLNHPSIVTIYDIGEEGSMAYIAMEFIEGQTLQDWMLANPIPPIEQTVSIVEQIAAGLDYAASRGIIHRDIKPQNILLTSDLRAKIADFGIAKFASSKLTQTGTVMGTPSYMSPEQAMGKALDGRSDVFSLGVILYELLTGEKPFSGSNPATIMYKILHEEPVPPKRLNVTLHPAFDRIVGRMLAKDPELRYQTCGEVIRDLKNYQSIGGEGEKAAVPPAPKRRVFAWFVFAVILLGVAGSGGYYLYRTQSVVPPQPVQKAIAREPPGTPPVVVGTDAPLAQAAKIEVRKGDIPARESETKKSMPEKNVTAGAARAAVDKPAARPSKKEAPVVEKPAFAQIRVDFAEAEYPFVIFDGERRLPDVSATQPVRVAAGEHDFRIISEDVFLDRRVPALRLKADEVYSLALPGLGSAYIEVPNDAYDGCEIQLDGKKLMSPYPAQVPKVAAGDHRINFRWNSGKYAGKEVASTIAIEANHLYRVRGEPQNDRIVLQQIR